MPSHRSCSQKRQVRARKSSRKFDHVNAVWYKKIYPDPEDELEAQFFSWASDWDGRVFHNMLHVSGHLESFFYSEHQHRAIIKLVDLYHSISSETVNKDRFAWTCFACAIIKEHRHRFSLRHGLGHRAKKDLAKTCSLHKCFYVLLWISFHLRLSAASDLVKEILTEILVCTRSLQFMFSFLPSMSLQLYMQLLWSNPPPYEDKLCREFFGLFNVNLVHRSLYKEAYKLSRPMLLYLVHHLRPLHHNRSGVNRSRTLANIINRPILYGRRFTLLFIAVRFHDEELVRALVSRGASADRQHWDAFTESCTSAEKLMVSTVNAIAGTHQFLAGLLSQQAELKSSSIDVITRYAPLFRRSVLRSQLRKSSDKWTSENSMYELNAQIADAWGIGCQPVFPSLQHICKIVIRAQILKVDNTLLPEAAERLPLPNKLIRYINLELD